MRVLSRVKCSCPLQSAGAGCSWTGDYSEISSHLTSSESHRRSQVSLAGKGSEKAAKETANALKNQGNALFEARKYREAMNLYTKAISMAPEEPTYYSNRAAAWIRVGAFKEAVTDCKQAIAIDPHFLKGHIRLSTALVQV